MASTQRPSAPTERWIALLGRQDTPTDGVEDYCTFLGRALARRGIELKKVRLRWNDNGRFAALHQLWRESAEWRGNWVLLQYTALAWSRRGFSPPVLAVLRVLRQRAARCAVVFHDASVPPGLRLRDRVRNAVQNWTMRKLLEQSEQGILTVPPETLHWLPAVRTRPAFIPIGANIPAYCGNRVFSAEQTPKIVAVFSVTGGDARSQEVHDIALAARRVKELVGPVRLEVFGRGADEAHGALERALDGSGVELRVRGVIPAEEITVTLATAHALLSVRGLATARRGTAIAGIACGLPVVGFGEPGIDPAIEAAGTQLVPWRDPKALADALLRVLTDATLWQELHKRNLRAQAEDFSWDVVAARFVAALKSSVDHT
jgi:glycosyltransferase involved in cell wall biosynthesis